ncbi:hypothetical protein O181_076629 [Austropuccinia psidii MF-1]|uniref:Retrovirus-related Pol polyprotein from transposon TNT 1-94-like beta-barrel domain-containing protein n=1 Tax=Austropuccinia psidii MF-1 TaxID=1389203 RepID=A0A9Q3FDC9_9BASI|nr:hypothetical protein [Austropuccinia psidii MF-1]
MGSLGSGLQTKKGWATGQRGSAEKESKQHPEKVLHFLSPMNRQGATHHVTGNATLFTEYQKINLTLSVASANKHLVVGKGIIHLSFPSANLRLTEVLHCPNIPATVLSIGKFLRNDGEVKFEDGLFKLMQNSCTHYSSLKGDRWFLFLGDMLICTAISDYSKDVSHLFH